jgi:hypothetical protein
MSPRRRSCEGILGPPLPSKVCSLAHERHCTTPHALAQSRKVSRPGVEKFQGPLRLVKTSRIALGYTCNVLETHVSVRTRCDHRFRPALLFQVAVVGSHFCTGTVVQVRLLWHLVVGRQKQILHTLCSVSLCQWAPLQNQARIHHIGLTVLFGDPISGLVP